MAVAGAPPEGKASATTKISSESLRRGAFSKEKRILTSILGVHNLYQILQKWTKAGNLESSGTPVHELDAPLALDRCNGSVHVLWHNVPAVEHAAGHVLACKSE